MAHLLSFIFVFLMLVQLSCSPQQSCSIDPLLKDKRRSFAAGCFVLTDNGLLLVRDTQSRRWGFPAGHAKPGELAQCAATRETREETGLTVNTQALLKEFSNGFLLYQCELRSMPSELRVPIRALGEIDRVSVKNLADMSAQDWRFPEQFPLVQDLLKQVTDNKTRASHPGK